MIPQGIRRDRRSPTVTAVATAVPATAGPPAAHHVVVPDPGDVPPWRALDGHGLRKW